jgi:molecular chaperone DnaK
MASDNRPLGRFQLAGIPPAPRGVPQIEVTFDIDVDGILNVSAQDKATGKEQKITITSSSGLDKASIERMVREAKDNEEGDRNKREMVEARNKLDSLVYQSQKMMDDLGDKISDSDKTITTEAITTATSALESNDKQTMLSATQTLEAALHGLAQTMYASEQPVSPQPHESDSSDDDIIDAEFVEE